MADDDFALMSLWLASSSARPVLFAIDGMPGSFEGGLSPLGRRFSDRDGGRSIAAN